MGNGNHTSSFAPPQVRELQKADHKEHVSLSRLAEEIEASKPVTRRTRFEWNGEDLYVDAVLINRKQAEQFIAAMSAIVPFLPEDS